eukprot:CAMPEP_0204565108 /NCGR_PEP_ID=MMETSP0661-20131031/35284_1 /ASSEMBLY_ACC=CAM_ASM_000606 /TAXON_ID=109239 /ORGANISM="Alexandrium margalefi, Strain AMGDE01CS-322" /LENGTH=69 /DNA_ID=CAMNT_0051572825 /DNA_START=65 /DNA_END=271 /DNA_ORIENTATION=-
MHQMRPAAEDARHPVRILPLKALAAFIGLVQVRGLRIPDRGASPTLYEISSKPHGSRRNGSVQWAADMA